MAEFVVEAAKKAHREHWKPTSDESTGDKQARKVAKEWQDEVVKKDRERFRRGVKISDRANERIDLVDLVDSSAYELKASGKNRTMSFTKTYSR